MKMLFKNKFAIFFLLVLGIFYYIFRLDFNYEGFLLLLIILLTISILIFKVKFYTLSILALIFLILSLILLVLDKNMVAEGVAIWFYILMFFAVIKLIYDK